MKLKIRNVILLILHTVATMLLFLPSMYIYDAYERSGNSLFGGIDVQIPFIEIAIGNFFWSDLTELFAIAILALFFVVFLVLLLQAIGKNERQQNSIVALVFSIVNFVVFFLFSYYWSSFEGKLTSGGGFRMEVGDTYYIEMILQIVLVVTFIITYVQTNRRIAAESSNGSAE